MNFVDKKSIIMYKISLNIGLYEMYSENSVFKVKFHCCRYTIPKDLIICLFNSFYLYPAIYIHILQNGTVHNIIYFTEIYVTVQPKTKVHNNFVLCICPQNIILSWWDWQNILVRTHCTIQNFTLYHIIIVLVYLGIFRQRYTSQWELVLTL